MRARFLVLFPAAAAAISCGGGNGINSVEVKGFRFQPAAITIEAGFSVEWTQTDNTTHTITSGVPDDPDGNFDHREFAQDEKFTHTFDEAGTYPYFCNIHNSMTGTVTVTRMPR
jgi:plastocyanin